MSEERTTEQRIVDATYGVMVENGFDGFTTQAVADAAGVSQSLIHYYFERKEDLVVAMFENGLDYLTDAVEGEVGADDPRDRLLGLARYIVLAEDEESLTFSRVILGLQSRAPYDERLREAARYRRAFLRDYVEAAVEEGIETGRFREVDSEAFAAMFVAATTGGLNWTAIFGGEEETDGAFTPGADGKASAQVATDADAVLAGLETVVDDFLVAA
jgi:AcrR family transcriptional regulator